MLKRNKQSRTHSTASLSTLLGEGSASRIALDEINAVDFSQTDVNQLVAAGTLVPEINTPELKFSRELFKSLNIGASVGLGLASLDDGRVVRRDAYKVNAGASANSLALGKQFLPANLGLEANATVEYFRIFSDKSRAALAKPFLLTALPITAPKALAMGFGDIAVLPTQSQISLDLNNQFLEKAWTLDRGLGTFIKAGLQGSLAATGQGMLLAQGQVVTHIVRLPGSHVRVRTALGSNLDAHLGVGVAAGNTLTALFAPFARIHKIAEINRVTGPDLTQARIAQIQSVNRDVKLILPDALQLLVKSVNPHAQLSGQTIDVLAAVGARVDDAAELSEKYLTHAQEIETKTTDRVNEAIDKLNAPRARLNKVVDAVTRVTNSTVDLSASVELGADFNSKSRLLTDYIFDLSSDEGKRAFEHAVSGRAVWLGNVPGWLASKQKAQKKSLPLLDYSLAERISRLDQTIPVAKRRVQRVTYTGTTMEQKSVGVNFNFAFSSLGFKENWKKNRLSTRSADVTESGFYGAVWKYNISRASKLDSSDENKTSGFVVRTGPDGKAVGLAGYWYGWRSSFAAGSSNVQQAFVKVLNELGS